MTTQHYSDQRVLPNSKIHNSLRHSNPPDLTREDPPNPRHPRSILSQNQFASSIIPVPPIGLTAFLDPLVKA